MKGLFGFALLVVVTATTLALAAQGPVAFETPSAAIPSRPAAPAAVPATPQPNQTVQRTVPTLDEEMTDAISAFQPAYAGARKPRILILFNRAMEDNDDETMIKTGKVEAGASTVTKSGGKETRERTDAGASVYAPATSPNALDKQSIEMLREYFERPFISAAARLIDRETAIRMHGLDEEAVFAYQDLPETQRAQVAGVKEFADIIITVRVEAGTGVIRKVSGDYRVCAPNIVARAVQLSDARVIASATTNDVAAGSAQQVATRVALALMQRLTAAWPAPAPK